MRNPKKRIIIYDVRRGYDQEQLKRDIYQQHFKDFEDQTFKDSFYLLLRTVKPPLFGTIIGNGRLFLGWLSYKLKECVAVTRRYRCRRSGHLSKDCQDHFAKHGHEYSTCRDRDKPLVYANCHKTQP